MQPYNVGLIHRSRRCHLSGNEYKPVRDTVRIFDMFFIVITVSAANPRI